MSEELKYPTQGHGAIPSFQSMEEEVAWWDETDTGAEEIEAEMTPVKVRSTGKLTKQLMIRFDEETDRTLDEIAAEEDLKKSHLVRRIVKAWVREERARRQAS